ncbi:MAG: hemerythrin domain-containing protein [Candidatus Brocadiales bacterium]|nr:hemerythrin domain-containing protein [Candidatus Bathyanammoxibius sp.]
MTRPTEPIRDHHKMLHKQIDTLFENVEKLQKFSAQERGKLDDLMNFLKNDLLPHAEGEERHLYKKVGELMKNPLFTKTMELDHQHIKQYISELETEINNVYKDSADATVRRVQTAATKLRGIIEPHFQKEDDVYLPILDEKLSAEQVYLDVIKPMHGHGGGHGHGHDHGHAGHGHEGHGHEGHGHEHGHSHGHEHKGHTCG